MNSNSLDNCVIGANATDRVWSWSWGEFIGPEPAVEICALKYDKRWVYSLDVDDMPLSNYTVSLPLLSKYCFTDAPPGIKGGNRMPFVGNAAVYASHVNPTNEHYDPTLLCWGQIRELREAGWGIANHAYSHAAYDLAEDQIRQETYWNQVLIAWSSPCQRTSNYFVYPCGDTDYRLYLSEYGLLAGGVSGEGLNCIHRDDFDWLDVSRIYLDEAIWLKNDDPYHRFPDPPRDGDVVVDFTHGMESDPVHPNRVRWRRRLDMIESLYGGSGADDMWSATIDEAVAYDLARRSSKVEISSDGLTLMVDGHAPSTPITMKVTGIPESMGLDAPGGGLLYRQGDTVWVTTPSLGGPVGGPLPSPALHCIYSGPVRDLDWPEMIELAGVRVHQSGGEDDGAMTVKVVEPCDRLLEIGSSAGHRPAAWILFSSVPNAAPWRAKGLRVDGVAIAHTRMEVWAVDKA